MTTATIIARVPKNATEDVIVALDQFKGIDILDVRVFADFEGTGEKKPTKRGIAIRADKIPELRAALQDAEAEAARLGLIGLTREGTPDG